ncbi:MAG: GNAT family N-acetyltransferase [Pseudomonadota bacterium]
MSGDSFTVHPVDQARWPDLVALFEARGGPKYCWCMAWRTQPPEAKEARNTERNAVLKAALGARVADGMPIGLLGYCDGEAIAWCSFAPRPTFRRLGGPEDDGTASQNVWSLTCFFIKRAFRGRGLSERLLNAALAYARRQNAACVEAYPVEPDSPSYRFMGLTTLFERAGFVEVGRAGTRRHVMRFSLH